jgi:hypothetical protein
LRFLRKSKGTTQAHTRHRVNAAVFLAEGDLQEARRLARQGLDALATTSNPAIAQLDTDLLQAIMDEIKAHGSVGGA